MQIRNRFYTTFLLSVVFLISITAVNNAAAQTLTVVSGNNQTGARGTVLPTAVKFRLLDAGNNPYSGRTISIFGLWGAALRKGGRDHRNVSITETTDSNGEVVAYVRLSSYLQTCEIWARYFKTEEEGGGNIVAGTNFTVTGVFEFSAKTATRLIASTTAANVNIGKPIPATNWRNTARSGSEYDPRIYYALSGTDAAHFSIDGGTEGTSSGTGQLKTKGALNSATKNQYEVTITAWSNRYNEENGVWTEQLVDTLTKTAKEYEATITVTIDVNSPPAFSESSVTRTVQDNIAIGGNVGSPITATDLEGDAITHTLHRPTDPTLPDLTDVFDISIDNARTGQITTKVALSSLTTLTYSGRIFAYDRFDENDDLRGTVIDVTITINKPPIFSDGTSTTRSIAENTASGTNIGSAVAATDKNSGDTLAYSLGGTDAASFSIDTTSGQLQTAASLDYETKNSYSVTVGVSDGNNRSDSITVTITVKDPAQYNNPPQFSEGTTTTRNVFENSPAGTDIGNPVAATDADTGDTLTYSLGGTDVASFTIDSTTGQLRTAAALDYETQTIYTVTVNVFDRNGGQDSITVTIYVTDINETGTTTPVQQNNPPHFSEGAITTRTVFENTPAGTDIGQPVAATDTDTVDTLTYSLSGTDAASFSIDNTTGQ